MIRLSSIPLLFIVTCTAFTQITDGSISPGEGRKMWEPSAWDILPKAFPEPTVAKEMLATLRVADFLVRLEETKMEDVRTRLGGEIGESGDAGDFLAWLCFQGKDAKGGWVLWLESDEIDGGAVGSFQWRRLSKATVLDARCQTLQGGRSRVDLPIKLRLDTTQVEALRILGPPTVKHGDRLIYIHEHQESIRGVPYTSTNAVAILLRRGRVSAIEVLRATVS